MLAKLILLGIVSVACIGVPRAAQPQAQPPTLVVTCSAQPSTITAGADVQITAKAVSLQNHRTSYSFKASSGKLVAGASSATLHTAANSPETITVTCNAVDDHGAEASQTAMVTVRQP